MTRVTSEERWEGEVWKGMAAGRVGEVKFNSRIPSTKRYISHDNMFENRGRIKVFPITR